MKVKKKNTTNENISTLIAQELDESKYSTIFADIKMSRAFQLSALFLSLFFYFLSLSLSLHSLCRWFLIHTIPRRIGSIEQTGLRRTLKDGRTIFAPRHRHRRHAIEIDRRL